MNPKNFDLPAELPQASASAPEVHPLLAEVQADRSAQQAVKGHSVQDNSDKPVITAHSLHSIKLSFPDGASQAITWDPKTFITTTESTGPKPEENYSLLQWPDRSANVKFADGTGYTVSNGAGANDGIEMHHWGPKQADNYDARQWKDGTEEVSRADGTGVVEHLSKPGPGYTLHHWGPQTKDNFDYASDDKQYTVKYADGTGAQVLTDSSGSLEVHSWGPNPQDNYTKTYPVVGKEQP